jgi:hypothetical protein
MDGTVGMPLNIGPAARELEPIVPIAPAAR